MQTAGSHLLVVRLQGRLMKSSLLVIAFIVAAPTANEVAAQAFPSRVVRIVVPGPPGGNSDALARTMAARLTTAWRQQVIVDNRAGASGMIGSELVAKAPPDGYTFMIGHNGTHAITTSIRKLTYDPVADFAPITLAAKFPNVFVAHPSLPVRSIGELIKLAKARPGELSYGTSGIGFPQHLAGEGFNMRAGVRIMHIPYKGTAPALVDTMAGNITLMISNLAIALPQIRSGRARALGLTSLERSSAAPEIPTIAESGLPGYEVITWYGFFAPAATPAEIVQELHAQMTAALNHPDTKALIASQGGEIAASSPKEFRAFVRSELARWAEVVKATGAKAE